MAAAAYTGTGKLASNANRLRPGTAGKDYCSSVMLIDLALARERVRPMMRRGRGGRRPKHPDAELA